MLPHYVTVALWNYAATNTASISNREAVTRSTLTRRRQHRAAVTALHQRSSRTFVLPSSSSNSLCTTSSNRSSSSSSSRRRSNNTTNSPRDGSPSRSTDRMAGLCRQTCLNVMHTAAVAAEEELVVLVAVVAA